MSLTLASTFASTRQAMSDRQGIGRISCSLAGAMTPTSAVLSQMLERIGANGLRVIRMSVWSLWAVGHRRGTGDALQQRRFKV